MSTIAERARNEADEAEREENDAAEAEELETPPEPDPEPETPPAGEPVTEARLKKIGKAIEGEDTRHEKRLREIYGDLWGERETCPLCLQEGFVEPIAPGAIDPEHRLAILSVIGDAGEPVLKQHPELKECPKCEGQGMLATGSKRAGFTEQSCPQCTGNGWVNPSMEPSAQVAVVSAPVYTFPTTAPNGSSVNTDQWGRPAGHPHWGQNPADVGIPL